MLLFPIDKQRVISLQGQSAQHAATHIPQSGVGASGGPGAGSHRLGRGGALSPLSPRSRLLLLQIN